jgi:hypothetical protein
MPQGFPVVLSDTGTPFVSVAENAPLATIATNGLGTPIRLVTEGAHPLIIQGLPEPDPEMLALASDDGALLTDDDENLMETF